MSGRSITGNEDGAEVWLLHWKRGQLGWEITGRAGYTHGTSFD